MQWHAVSSDDVLKEISSSVEGLSQSEAAARLEKNGPNQLSAKKKKTAFAMFIRQFMDVMVLVLIVAGAVSAFIGEVSDTIVIGIIVILNAIIGFVQEYRAGKAMEALQQMTVPKAKVKRDGKPIDIPATDLVVGDLVMLDAGDRLPADLRLIEVHSLAIDEAGLTGESVPVDKTSDAINDNDLPLGDRTNMAYNGTSITKGTANGTVVATGMQTELGKIAGLLQDDDGETPLQKRMGSFSKRLTFIIAGLCVVLFLVGWLRGEDPIRMLLTSLSLAVAAIPEALPAVITVSLALGARRLVKQNALIRKLHAVETLGSVTYICTDKTGTLTKNQMTVQETWLPDGNEEALLLLAMELNHDVKEKEGKLAGDPTETAMVEFAAAKNANTKTDSYKRVGELPFDSDRKAMTTIHEHEGKFWVITKGAAEKIAEISSDQQLDAITAQEQKMAEAGMRVIGFGYKQLDTKPAELNEQELESGLNFLGLVGLSDPPREEAKDAIKQCKEAGIIPVMITGDHPLTATAIAREMGIIASDKEETITGKELEKLDDKTYANRIANIRVYARVSPEQKLKIVTTLQKQGQFVSMTGDGVNDAPAVKKANIGVVMGITGTDVAKEASHMILLDDNFATIVKAVKEGRRIYDNIRKFIRYIMTGNSAEIWCIFLAPFLGLPIPLQPVHILWVNLITDGLPALALATEGHEPGSMKRPPRKPDESVFAHGLGVHIIWVGLLIAGITLCTQWLEIRQQQGHWQTIVFTILCFSQLWHVLAIRRERESSITAGFENPMLLLAVLATVGLQFAVIYIPGLNSFFHTQPLTFKEVLLALGVSSIAFWAVEIEKLIARRKK